MPFKVCVVFKSHLLLMFIHQVLYFLLVRCPEPLRSLLQSQDLPLQ